MALVFMGLGSNIGDKESNFLEAIDCIERSGDMKITARSGFYLTRPEGGPPQADYLNGVIGVKTSLSPEECLGVVKKIEKEMGRELKGRNHPRIIDIDILTYNDLVHVSDELTIPHPRMHQRYFVLKGLSEIAPGFVHPATGRTIRELYAEVKEKLCR